MYYDAFETNWGWVAAAGTAQGLRYTTLPEPSLRVALDDLVSIMRTPLPEQQPGGFEVFQQQLREYLTQGSISWSVTLDLTGSTPFFRRAWEACSSIPAGETRTYQWLAEAAGNPRAARGAGQAMARNRIPVIIPCHRVIGKDGGLHGFAGPGLPMKERLLRLEAGI
jgi:O-6-methylguanine DNA methyltransferase